MRLLAHLLANGLALIALARLIPAHVSYTSDGAVVVFAIVLTLLNMIVRPLLHLITFPLSCVTLGFFTIVLNAALFYVAGRLSVGIHVDALGALAGTLTVSILTGILIRVFRDSRK